MRDPSPELVTTVRRVTRAWGSRRRLHPVDIEDLQGDALEWLCTYDPPEGWNVTGATLYALTHWALNDIAKKRTRERAKRPFPVGLPCADLDGDDNLTRADRNLLEFIFALSAEEQGYATVEWSPLLDELSPFERDSLIADGEGYGAKRAVADRYGMTQSAVTCARNRARARILEALD